jgi:RNA polymerase sigma factor (sigma-70 family)
MDDAALLCRYAQNGDGDAFTELVRRNLNFVYAAALRQVGGDAQLAQDVTQVVFTDLARKAAVLKHHPVLKGWLFTSARFAASKLVRRERLRQDRERSAHAMQESTKGNAAPIPWEEIRPVLDEVLAELKAADRDAVLLRFFESDGYAEVGTKLCISEDAARMRVERALDQIRDRLARRGVTSTSVALATMLSTQAGIAAPVGLVQSVASTALAQAAGGVPVAGLLQFMGTKTTFGVASLIWLAGILSIPMGGVAIYETRAARRAEIATATAQREQAVQINRLKALQQEAGDSEVRVAEIPQILEQAQAGLTESLRASASAAVPQPRDPRTDGARFLASFPQARTLLIEAGRVRTPPELLEIYQRAGLTSAQIDDLDTRTWANRVENLTLSPTNGMGWSVVGFPPDDEMRQLLGDAGFREFEDYKRMADVHGVAAQVASAVAYNAPPLTAAQIEQLAHAIYKVAPNPTLAPGTPEWDAAMAPLQSLMTPAQWQVAEGAFASVLFPRLLAWTQRTAANRGGGAPKSP